MSPGRDLRLDGEQLALAPRVRKVNGGEGGGGKIPSAGCLCFHPLEEAAPADALQLTGQPAVWDQGWRLPLRQQAEHGAGRGACQHHGPGSAGWMPREESAAARSWAAASRRERRSQEKINKEGITKNDTCAVVNAPPANTGFSTAQFHLSKQRDKSFSVPLHAQQPAISACFVAAFPTAVPRPKRCLRIARPMKNKLHIPGCGKAQLASWMPLPFPSTQPGCWAAWVYFTSPTAGCSSSLTAWAECLTQQNTSAAQ